ncbi:hypothetical protein SALBM311S_00682 [Streptomyces alboniger]
MPTRGSPGLSSWTCGCLASQSMSLRASATSPFGSFSPILPVDLPKLRDDQVSTAYPSRARPSACCRTSALLPPKPCARRTAGRRPVPPEVKYEVSMRTPSRDITRSARCTGAGASSATAVHVPAPASTTTTAAAAPSRRGPRSRPRSRGSRRSMRQRYGVKRSAGYRPWAELRAIPGRYGAAFMYRVRGTGPHAGGAVRAADGPLPTCSVVAREAQVHARRGVGRVRPAGGDDLAAGVEVRAVVAVDVVVAEERVLPATEGVVADRGPGSGRSRRPCRPRSPSGSGGPRRRPG